MQPYESPLYFIILGICLLPLVIGHLFGKKWMTYQVIFTIIFLYIGFSGSVTLFSFVGFGIWQTILIKLYNFYRKRSNQMFPFILSVILSIAPLAIVKISPVINSSHPSSIFGFLGISYLSFRSINVIMDLRDGLVKEVSTLNFLYFLFFFPTYTSGPIDRYRRFEKELKQKEIKNYPVLLNKGIFSLFLGFLYKFIIGYLIDTHILHEMAIRATIHPTFLNMLIVMYAYGFYLFFDFAGYSLFAVGVSYLMGYDVPINFDKPFLSRNIKEFWNRWHMSLSFWFRDFVYMRLVYFIMKKKLMKNTIAISNVAYIGLFGLMGIWHGVTWYYILYGFYHAALMILTDVWLRWKKKHKGLIPENKLMDWISRILLIHAVLFSFLIFSGMFDFAIKHYINPSRMNLPNF
ncbi:MAG: D-alanyl-lipoteichoic acid biosynthesis protein DltB [Streptococcaceae bacterium]|jgi:membrane protein involved in D-alanine export|nr:D-alanyl-lipoteichoic acid biosynthesis protein DltB [Streptococcaceae bacterium]